MRLAAIVLAAGAGTRFGGNKLSAPFRGEPLVAHAIRAARAAPVERVIVVQAPGLDAGGRGDAGPPVEALLLHSTAQSETLRAGIAAAGEAEGVFVFLGDMPLVPHHVAARLAAILGSHFAALPRFNGQPGHPVLLSRRACAHIGQLEGDQGAGRLLRARKDIAFLDCEDEGVVLDVDRVDDIARLEARSGA